MLEHILFIAVNTQHILNSCARIYWNMCHKLSLIANMGEC